jgi:predicted transcriptional regulator
VKEHDRGAEFTASDEEVEERIQEVADEVGQTPDKVRENVEHMLDASGDNVSTSFNESVSGESLDHDEVGEGDPRLEALELYRLRQRI